MKTELIHKFDLRQYPYRMNWEITQQCNFECEYCSNSNTVNKTNPPRVYTPSEIATFFNQTGKEWLILITGGEPFLYPDFVNVCKVLSLIHFLQITTNLSSVDVYEFADTIAPEKIFNISASFHYYYRSSENEKKEFIKKCHYLLERNFKLITNLIAYPPLISIVENDIAMLESEGIDTMLFGFRGIYGGKRYPYEYNADELELLKKYAIDDTELKIATNSLNYYGYYCEAGSHYFSMKENGDIGRCFTLPKKIGNLFDGGFNTHEILRPCIAKQCTDCYNGPASITNIKANWFKIWHEKNTYKKNSTI